MEAERESRFNDLTMQRFKQRDLPGMIRVNGWRVMYYGFFTACRLRLFLATRNKLVKLRVFRRLR